MKTPDYYRHRLDLFVSGEVRFTSGEEAVEFIATYIKEAYLKYLSGQWLAAATLQEEEDWRDRMDSETRLVSQYVQDFLYQNLPDTTCWCYKLAQKFRPAPIYRIDTHSNSQLYENVLKRLGRTNDVTVEDAFPSLRLAARLCDGFEIEGNSIVRIY